MKERENIIKSFGEAVQVIRVERDLSQDELASRIGMQRTYISDVERGVRNTSISNAKRIAKALNVSLAKIIEMAESENE